MSSAHKPGANDLIVTERVKSRWSDEEKRLLALFEAKLVFGGVPSGGINRELMLKLQGRTLESIKGRRRAQDYRDKVAVFLAGLQGNLRAPIAERETTVSTAGEARTERFDDDGAEAVGDRVGTLNHLSAAESGAQKAIDLLSTVTGHGVQKLLTAAQRLVEESRNPNHAIAVCRDNDRFVTVLESITPEEVEASLPSAKTAPGPDGFPARLWRRLPCNLIAGLFNMFNATGSLPIQLVQSRTIFVVKKGDPKCLGNYRPISIASIAIRHYHRVLAKRLEKLSVVDSRQHAFRCADGVAENLFLLDSVLKDARSSVKGLCLASLDLSKAFDSVSHASITSAMRGVGLDPRFVEYIRATYQSSETVIQVSGQSSRGIRPRCGVRQGDPLSPLLFNMVVDTDLRAIPDAVGYTLGQTVVNAIAFADDVILVAETPSGLRLACEAFTRRLENSGVPAVRAAYGLHGKSALAGARRPSRLKPSHMQDLHASVDGSELKLCSEESASVAYLRRPHGIPSSDFKEYARIRINALPTRKRVNRGKAGLTRCRACGLVDETLAHVSQACQRTHDGRILRYDCLVKRITGGLREKRYEVEVEHQYKLHGGNLKPDIVATISDETRGRVFVICDVQVVSGAEPRTWHSCKVDKYADRADLKAAIRPRHLSTEVRTVAATLTWRGVWVPESFRKLRELGLSRGLLEELVTRVLRGTQLSWYTFNQRILTHKARTGVG
ncbi:hypothetical protein QTP88_010983 [Uroleucon formosanum]